MENNNVNASSTEDCIAIRALSKSIKGKTILNYINATVAHGDVVALLGANAAGKSTLIETMLGFNIPDSGDVYYEGGELAINLSNHQLQLSIHVGTHN